MVSDYNDVEHLVENEFAIIEKTKLYGSYASYESVVIMLLMIVIRVLLLIARQHQGETQN